MYLSYPLSQSNIFSLAIDIHFDYYSKLKGFTNESSLINRQIAQKRVLYYFKETEAILKQLAGQENRAETFANNQRRKHAPTTETMLKKNMRKERKKK